MATKAGQIVINIRAGTKQLRTDLKDGSGAVREFGKQTLTSMQGASAAIRLASGDITHNVRAVEQFLTKTLGMGDALKAIFPIVGAVAFGGLIDALATKVGNFFSELNEKAAQSRYAFANMDAAVRLTNDGLAVTNSRLKNELAQIEGLPQNNLRTALLEAQEAAHKLNQELERSIEDRRKLIIDQPEAGVGFTGWLERTGLRLAAGSVGTKDIADRMREFEQQTQGLQGEQLKSALGAELQSVKSLLATSLDQQDKYAKEFSLVGAIRIGNPEQRIADLKNYKTFLEEFQTTIQRTNENSSLGVKLGGAQDKHRDDLLERPIQDKLKQLDAELQNARLAFENVGTAASEGMGKGLGKAAEDIEGVNKRLEKLGPKDQMNALDALGIIFRDTAIAQYEAETKLQTALIKTTDTLKDRVKAQELLNKSVGGTYAERQESFANSAIFSALGAENYKNATSDQIAPLQALLRGEFAGQESGKAANALQQLSEKLRITQAMTAAAKDGAIAEQAAELAERRRIAEAAGDLGLMKEIDAEIRELAATRKKAVAQDLAEMDLQASAMKRLAAAYGAKARLEAEAQNAKAAANRKYGDGSAAGDAAYAHVYAEDQAKVAEAAHKAASADSDHLSDLQRMKNVLSEMKVTDDNRLEIAHALRDVNDQILVATASSLEKNDSIVGGLQAGLDRIAASAETISKIVSDAMQNMVNQTSSVMADMLTGKKPKGGYGQEFGKMFQGIGHEMVQSTLKSGLSATLKHFGLAKGQLGSSPSNPIYTRSADGLPGLPGNAVPNPLGGLKGLGGLFGGGQQGTSPIFSALASLPGLAEGATDVYPGSSYVVGDGGEPEVFTPKTSGSVTPAHKIGGSTYHYSIDARGAEIGAENRIAEAIEMAHNSAIAGSVRADHELSHRTPQRSGR